MERYCSRDTRSKYTDHCKFQRLSSRYVWHCHILEHEDNEMMRPFEVVKL